jgi:recombinational DNA repair protein (RecF pathway)
MSALPVQTTKAIVIKSQSLGEIDKIINFYMSDFDEELGHGY